MGMTDTPRRLFSTPQAAMSDTINSTWIPRSDTQSLQLTSHRHSKLCTRNVLISTRPSTCPSTTRMTRCGIKSVPKVANVTADTLDTTATRAFALLVTTLPVTVARTPLETCNS